MKVILNQDVSGIGRKYEVKDVAEGHAINYLFPRKLALLASQSAIERMNTLKLKTEAEKGVQNELILKNLKDLENKTITIKAKAGEKGNLFAGIHKEEISKAIKDQLNLDIPPNLIDLDHPIKEVGSHQIKADKAEFEVSILKD